VTRRVCCARRVQMAPSWRNCSCGCLNLKDEAHYGVMVVASRKVPAAANPQTSLDAGDGVQAQDFSNLQRTMVLF
jgi:hypothetical protein